MKKLLNILFISLALISVGCMSDTGRVYLDTKPEGATVYVNDHMIGETQWILNLLTIMQWN